MPIDLLELIRRNRIDNADGTRVGNIGASGVSQDMWMPQEGPFAGAPPFQTIEAEMPPGMGPIPSLPTQQPSLIPPQGPTGGMLQQIGNQPPPPQAPPMPGMEELPQTPFNQMGGPQVDPNSAIEQLRKFQAETRANDRLNQLLEHTPTREDPSIARKILASARGLVGGPKAAEEIMYQPYERAMADWKEKTGPYSAAATAERGANANERQVLATLANAERDRLRIEETERHNKELEASRKVRDDAYLFKAKHPAWPMHARGPTLITFNMEKQEWEDTGIKTGALSEADKINLESKTDIAENHAKAVDQRQTNAERPQRESAGDREKNETAWRKRLFETDPDAREFLTQNSDGTFTLKEFKQSRVFTSGDAERKARYDAFMQRLYRGQVSGGGGSGASSGGGSAPASKTTPPAGPAGSSSPASTTVSPAVKTEDRSVAARIMSPKSEPTMPNVYNTKNESTNPMYKTQTVKKPSNESSGKGSIPSILKGIKDSEYIQGPKVITQVDNNGVMRRSLDGGKTWLFSTDGKTWTRTDPGAKGGK